MAASHFDAMLQQLLALPQESEWVEFKENMAAPQEIGEYISALANAATLQGKPYGYLVWGITNTDYRVVGTGFKPRRAKKGNEELEPWLRRLLSPSISFTFHEFIYQEKPIVLLEIPASTYQPVRFSGEEYCRIGSAKKKLRDYPETERQLWAAFRHQSFEEGVALAQLASDEILDLIDYPSTFKLLGHRLPDNRKDILTRLAQEHIIIARDSDHFDITNLGAILFSQNLTQFPTLGRKAIRTIFYAGTNRTQTIREQLGVRGYAVEFAGRMSYIMTKCHEMNILARHYGRKHRFIRHLPFVS